MRRTCAFIVSVSLLALSLAPTGLAAVTAQTSQQDPSPGTSPTTGQVPSLQATPIQTTPVQIDPNQVQALPSRTLQIDPEVLQRFQAAQNEEPDERDPRAVPVDWNRVSTDIQIQQRQYFNPTVGSEIQIRPFILPRNPDAGNAPVARLPILIPTLSALGIRQDAPAFLFPQRYFYTYSVSDNGLLVEVFGTRLAHNRAPDDRSGRRLRVTDGEGLRVERTEYGFDVSFNRFGVAYTVTVECDIPRADTRCTGETYARDLARTLYIAGGTPD
ncbi:hypothetical protein RMQ97_10790 [Maricaulis sp. D1M11]|uniref:hypothetical protein n=1 Tax=Maricaulis sp. D1M11 TaxID=3076117 RepID=UPI0039B45A3B